METFSALLVFCEGNSPVTSDFPSKSRWHGALFFLIYAWTKVWANRREVGDLRAIWCHHNGQLENSCIVIRIQWCVCQCLNAFGTKPSGDTAWVVSIPMCVMLQSRWTLVPLNIIEDVFNTHNSVTVTVYASRLNLFAFWSLFLHALL